MGDVHAPAPVLPFLAVTSRYNDAIDWALEQMEPIVGLLRARSEPFRFDQTDYYAATMGEGLSKTLTVHAPHPDPGDLPRWKLAANHLEAEFARRHARLEARPLNIDPGYVTLGKLVLASTKDHAHRIYLSQGIYAELTLQYRRGHWQTMPWTYPDYRSAAYHEFLARVRQFLRGDGRAPDSAPHRAD